MGCQSFYNQYPRVVYVIVLLLALLVFTWIPSTPEEIMTLSSSDDILKVRDFVEKKYSTEKTFKGNKSLPLIGLDEYMQKLENYVCTYPSQNVLVVWGAKSVGKTFGINIMVDMWKKQGRVVIDIDLKGFERSFDDFIELTRNAIRISTSPFKLNKFSLRKLNDNMEYTDIKQVETWFYALLGWCYTILEPILRGLGCISRY